MKVLRHGILGMGVVLSLLISISQMSWGQETEIEGDLFVTGEVGIGTTTVPHGLKGAARLAIEGANASVASGPHIQTTTATDDYPLVQLLSWSHDNIRLMFDSYFDGGWKSSDAGSNYMISKVSDVLMIEGESGVSAGDSITWTPILTLFPGGKVGVGTTSPADLLHVAGSLRMQNTSEPGTTASSAVFYAISGEMWVKDSAGNDYQLSSHRDPRTINPAAVTSFGDPAVQAPFSIHHFNEFTGKGAVVDVAKMAAYVEELMQADMGDAAGQLTYSFDLAPDQTKTLANYEAAQVDEQVRQALDELRTMPWVSVELGRGGELPPESVEEYEETQKVVRTVTETQSVVDFDQLKVVEVQVEKLVTDLVPTGRMNHRFKEGWEFRNGQLYRKPTVDDLDLELWVEQYRPLPQWVLDRMGSVVATAPSKADLIEQLRLRILASATEPEQSEKIADAAVTDPGPAG